MRRTINDIITELNEKLTKHHQQYTIEDYTRTYIRFSNGIVFNENELKKYRTVFIKSGKDRYFKHHDNIVCSESPLILMGSIVLNETHLAQVQGGKNCQKEHHETIKQNLNTGTPWNKDLKLSPSWNSGLTKDNSQSVMKISQAKLGKKNPCFGKVYTQ